MFDLQLIGVHPDEEHLLLMTPDGQRYRLAIDDALRAAVRRDRSALGQIQSSSPGAVRPRDIQAQIRAGHSAEQVAKAAGISVDHVRRYEGPVLAERSHLVAMVLRHRLCGDGPDQGRELGDVVTERLMSRDVREEPEWDSWRQDDGKWLVQLQFRAGTKSRKAQWTYHASKQTLEPVDDEARWFISGAQDAGDQPAAPVAAVPQPSPQQSADTSDAAQQPEAPTSADESSGSWASTEALLSHLNAQRGVRPHMAEAGEVAMPSTWQDIDLRDDQVLAPPPVHEDVVEIHEPATVPSTVEHAQHTSEVTVDTTAVVDQPQRHLSSVPVQVVAEDIDDEDDQRDVVVVEPNVAAIEVELAEPETQTPEVIDLHSPEAAEEVAAAEDEIVVEQDSTPAVKRRSSVPTWDEIMFGSKRKD